LVHGKPPQFDHRLMPDVWVLAIQLSGQPRLCVNLCPKSFCIALFIDRKASSNAGCNQDAATLRQQEQTH
jgi:hypothetical protein